MTKNIKYVGLDVHAESISAAVALGRQDVRSLGKVANQPDAVRRLLGKLGKPEELRVCYEAGPTGYALYWQLTKLGIACEVIAPSLIPKKPGDRVKTDRRDAEKLARCYRAGDLVPIWVPDAKHEAIRDLVRAREATTQDVLRAKHRLSKYLLRYGLSAPAKRRKWSREWWQWVRSLELDHEEQNVALLELMLEVEHQTGRVARLDSAIDRAVEKAPEHLRAVVNALQALRGVAKTVAVTLATEFGTFSRFEKASQVMSYTGLVSSEHSSGGKRRVGAITKAGNSHLRRVLIEAAWQYRHRPRIIERQKKLQGDWPPRVATAAWEAQQRLHRRYWVLQKRGKPPGVVVTSLARELAGFVWSIGRETEKALGQRQLAA